MMIDISKITGLCYCRRFCIRVGNISIAVEVGPAVKGPQGRGGVRQRRRGGGGGGERDHVRDHRASGRIHTLTCAIGVRSAIKVIDGTRVGWKRDGRENELQSPPLEEAEAEISPRAPCAAGAVPRTSTDPPEHGTDEGR